jgi:hypothetical protein
MEFIFYVTKNDAYDFDLTQLGYSASEAVPVHDIWTGEDLGTATGTISTSVPSHGVKLFRLGDKATTNINSLNSKKGQDAMIYEKSSVYDLSGRRFSNTSHLPSGIYINNGKKVVK